MRLKNHLEGRDNSFEIELLENSIEFHKHFLNINELFDKDVELEKPKWDGKYFSINFKIDDVIYFFKAKEDEPKVFGIQFFASGTKGLELQKSKKYTGAVFAGVKKSLEMLIKQKDVEAFYFNTEEMKLIKLYDKLIKWIENNFRGYKLTKSEIHKNRKIWIFEK